MELDDCPVAAQSFRGTEDWRVTDAAEKQLEKFLFAGELQFLCSDNVVTMWRSSFNGFFRRLLTEYEYISFVPRSPPR